MICSTSQLSGSFLSACLLFWVPGLSGCSNQSGPDRFALVGLVTYDGEPIKSGRIRFIPDKEAGNSGPGSVAIVNDGKFSVERKRGIVGGQYKLEVHGYGEQAEVDSDGEMSQGQPLFPAYVLSAILPKGGEIEFNVPVEAAVQDRRTQRQRR